MTILPPRRSYDEKQSEAVLTACISCRRWFYMTLVQQPCVACRG